MHATEEDLQAFAQIEEIIYILQIYWDWIGNGVLITEGAMIISNSHG